ncbi:MAG: pilin [Candidatus Gracilibacteria bacterium]|nr:pilin [Candidatus Gracilibacteria bacterium]
MKNLKYLLIAYLFSIHYQIFASENLGILGGVKDSVDITAKEKLRTGNITIDDIPQMIQYAINFLMGFAGTIALIFIIIGAYKIAFGGISNDKQKGKETIILAISGLILASLSWVILKIIIDNFT